MGPQSRNEPYVRSGVFQYAPKWWISFFLEGQLVIRTNFEALLFLKFKQCLKNGTNYYLTLVSLEKKVTHHFGAYWYSVYPTASFTVRSILIITSTTHHIILSLRAQYVRLCYLISSKLYSYLLLRIYSTKNLVVCKSCRRIQCFHDSKLQWLPNEQCARWYHRCAPPLRYRDG